MSNDTTIKVESWIEYIKKHPKFTGCIVDSEGTKSWYKNGKWHRENGPAIEYANGDKYWYLNGKFHRTNGPAVEYVNGYKEWWLNGEKLTKQQHHALVRQIKLKLLDTIQNSL